MNELSGAEPPFLDPAASPDRAAVERVLGDRVGLWRRLTGWVEATYGIEPEPLYSGKRSGWVSRYRRSGKSLLTVVPLQGGFQALVVIGPSNADRVSELDLQPGTRQVYEAAHAYPDGRWLLLTVQTLADVEDIVRLVTAKSPPPRRPRSRSAPVSTG
jgi:hypothetical protein